MTKVKLPNKSSVVFDGHQVPGLSQVLSVNNYGGELQIKNIGDPTDNQDVVTLAYFNAHSSPGQSPWLLASGGTLTNANTITGTTSNTLKFSFASLGTTQTDGAGIWLQNPTAATSGNQQISPLFTQEGQGFATGVNNSQSVKFAQDVLPVQAATNPQGTWRIRSSINGASYSDVLTVKNDGTLSIINGSNNLTITPANGILNFTGNINIQSSSQNRLQINSVGGTIFNQSGQASAWTSAITSVPGAHTGMTASTEFISRDFQASTQQWATGSLATQRWNYFRGYTAAFVGASTLADAYTIYAESPTAGTNATITRSWAAGFGGNVLASSYLMPSSGLGSTPNLGLTTTSGSSLNIGAVSNGGGNGWKINFQDSGGTVTYAVFSPSSGSASLASYAFGTTNITNAQFYILQGALSTSYKPAFRSDPGAHTGLTATTEFISRDFQGATQTWLDGTTTTQRFNYFRGYTVNKTTTSATFTDIYNVYIDTNTAGSGVTFSNNWALGIAGNTKIFNGSSILTLNPSAGIISSSIGLSLFSSGSNSISITGGNGGGSAIVKAGSSAGSAQLIDDSNSSGFNASNGEAFMFNPTESIDMLSFTTITTQGLALTQNAQTGSVRSLLTSSPANHTGMTASTEFISRDFQGATQTWLDGTTTTQRFNYFRAYTANKTTISLVFGDIYNVYIEQTTLNTGVSATNGNWALGVAGNAKMTGSRILLTGLPTSASGLQTGALWNNSGVINIAP